MRRIPGIPILLVNDRLLDRVTRDLILHPFILEGDPIVLESRIADAVDSFHEEIDRGTKIFSGVRLPTDFWSQAYWGYEMEGDPEGDALFWFVLSTNSEGSDREREISNYFKKIVLDLQAKGHAVLLE